MKKVREPFIFKTPLSLKDIIDEKWEFAQAEQKFGNVDPHREMLYFYWACGVGPVFSLTARLTG